MNTQLCWAERLTLRIEHKLSLSRTGWLVVYGITLLALLPTLMSLGMSTGLMFCAYATEGFYSLNELSPVQTLLWNLSCCLLCWFLCSCVILLCRCLRSHWYSYEYEAPCPLWISGCVLQAQLALLAVALYLTGAGGLWSVLPVALIVLLVYLRRRICQ